MSGRRDLPAAPGPPGPPGPRAAVDLVARAQNLALLTLLEKYEPLFDLLRQRDNQIDNLASEAVDGLLTLVRGLGERLDGLEVRVGLLELDRQQGGR